jgi:hypothetical protein
MILEGANMRNMLFSILTALVFFAATAVAQTTPSGAQGQSPEGTNSPSDPNSRPVAGQDQGYPTSSGGTQDSAAQNPGYGNQGSNQGTKEGEKKMKGCLKEESGQYMLETKSGKDIPLSGEGLSAHVGHEVAVHGSWANGGDMSGMSGGSSASTGNAKAFNVTSIDHLSDTCGGKHGKTTGASTTQPQ